MPKMKDTAKTKREIAEERILDADELKMTKLIEITAASPDDVKNAACDVWMHRCSKRKADNQFKIPVRAASGHPHYYFEQPNKKGKNPESVLDDNFLDAKCWANGFYTPGLSVPELHEARVNYELSLIKEEETNRMLERKSEERRRRRRG